jgi:UDP-2,4-diacetamido-2,4,6-trideoxy-beta-L-altropyranose hydrolase
MPHIALRVDASSRIGMGHLVRCATLAEALRARGSTITFVCRESAESCADWLRARQFSVAELPETGEWQETTDAAATAMALDGRDVDWLVVDHYSLGAVWERAVRPSCKRILVVDDLADRRHDCDLLLDQNYRRSSKEPDGDTVVAREDPYRDLLHATTPRLLGPRYALLRPEFAAARQRMKVRDGYVRRIVVSFGGTDAGNYAARALTALRPFTEGIERIDVLLGHRNPHLAELKQLSHDMPCVTLHDETIDVAATLCDADLAIGAGGSMTWERACLGVPTLAIGIAANQRHVIGALLEDGFICGIPAHTTRHADDLVESWLGCMLSSPALLRGLSTRSAALVDGMGVDRVVDRMLSPAIEFRRATLADAGMIYEWRNDASVRAVSGDDTEIDRETHQAWMERTLQSPERLLLIAERAGAPVGVVRFDLIGRDARLSVYRAPEQTKGRIGLVADATRWLRTQRPEIQRILATVLGHNRASLSAFRSAGYREVERLLAHEPIAVEKELGQN